MKLPARALVVLGLICLTFAVASTAELLSALVDPRLRLPAYCGGLAGVILAAAGVPFAARLSNSKISTEATFWKWWGLGVLLRIFLLLALALCLGLSFREHTLTAMGMMGGVYIVGMFAEAAWLARHFFQMNAAADEMKHHGMER